jgi:hypothetical protein
MGIIKEIDDESPRTPKILINSTTLKVGDLPNGI